ncbi:MAG: Lrp/AsnC ligand binding domain-containing protein [Rhodobacter sp.]|nr:Lrp/AsnC ligand binding domain-containing protein [Rhodobacter sp.]
MAAPVGRRDLVLDQCVDGFGIGHAQQRLCRAHQRDAFVEVKLSDTRERALAAFNAAVRAVPEIEQCHMLAASFDYLLSVRTRDMAACRRVLAEDVSTLSYVANTSTYVAVKEGGL